MGVQRTPPRRGTPEGTQKNRGLKKITWKRPDPPTHPPPPRGSPAKKPGCVPEFHAPKWPRSPGFPKDGAAWGLKFYKLTLKANLKSHTPHRDQIVCNHCPQYKVIHNTHTIHNANTHNLQHTTHNIQVQCTYTIQNHMYKVICTFSCDGNKKTD